VNIHRASFVSITALAACGFALLTVAGCASPQPVAPATIASPVPERFADIPGHDRYQDAQRQISDLRSLGRISNVRWAEDGSAFWFTRDDERYRFDLIGLEYDLVTDDDDREARDRDASPRAPQRPARGRQRDRERSPDGHWIASAEDWNVVLREVDNEDNVIHVTTDGERKHRFGKASWVYGEELRQIDAMWWSPDSTMLAYYEFDERQVPDYYLTAGNTDLRTRLLIEGYPKAGDPNPIAKLWIYHLETGEKVQVDVGEEIEQYVYRVRFSPNSDELIYHRTNRHQNVLELMAADVKTGASRTILTETQDTWQQNSPQWHFLDDGERFIWQSERTGWKNYELWHISGSRLAVLTSGEYPVASIERVCEKTRTLFYTAYSDPANALNQHLHRVDFEGRDHRKLTNRPLNHSVDVSPCGNWFIARYESLDTPAATALYDRNGKEIAVLEESDPKAVAGAGLTPPELFTVTAADGETTLYGMLFKPSDFDSSRRYPLVIDVYGGPYSQRVRNRFTPANAATEFGFIIATIDNRGTPNRGKRFEDAGYLKLGIVDMDDQVAAVKQLTERPYIDGSRVGIAGHSYGGYIGALGVLKHPDVFHVGIASAAVTDWRNYDTIYTERFMRLPDENKENYDAGSCLTYVDQLEGKLLILHGLVDDNVHPSNAWQLVHALQRAGKPFDMMMYPNAGHGLGAGARQLRWLYLYEHLIADPR
jgi:dipeptidyl-peptidase 4